MKSTLSRSTLLLCLNLLILVPAMSASSGSLPPEKTQGMINYISGGVGKDEADAMKDAEASYPLSLEFVQRARPKNEFVANVDVEIKNSHGDVVLKINSDGPFLLSKLPKGKYTVTAAFEGHAQTRHFTVSGHQRKHLIFEWK